MKQARWLMLSVWGAAVLLGRLAHAQGAPGASAPAPAAPPVVVPTPPAAANAEPLPPAAAPADATPAVEQQGDAAEAEAADVMEGEGPPGQHTVKLHFRSNQPGVVFHYVKLARANPDFLPRDWQRLCLGECDGRLQPGPYRFALSLGAGEPVMAPTLFETTTGGHLEGTYTDRSNRRLAGALILGLGGVASLASITTGTVLATDPYTERVGVATLAGGCVGVLLSLLIGLPLVGSSDQVDITPSKKGAH